MQILCVCAQGPKLCTLLPITSQREKQIFLKKIILPASVKVGREALVRTDDGGSVPEVISQRNTQEIPLPCRICTGNSKGIFCMRRTEINPKKEILKFDFLSFKGSQDILRFLRSQIFR